MFPVHQVWPKPSCKALWKGEEDKRDKGRGGKTTSGNEQAWSLASPTGQWRTWKNRENWLQNSVVPQQPLRLRDWWWWWWWSLPQKASRVPVASISGCSSFHSWMVLKRNENCLYCVWHWNCFNCLLLPWCWKSAGGWKLLLIMSVWTRLFFTQHGRHCCPSQLEGGPV